MKLSIERPIDGSMDPPSSRDNKSGPIGEWSFGLNIYISRALGPRRPRRPRHIVSHRKFHSCVMEFAEGMNKRRPTALLRWRFKVMAGAAFEASQLFGRRWPLMSGRRPRWLHLDAGLLTGPRPVSRPARHYSAPPIARQLAGKRAASSETTAESGWGPLTVLA